MRRGRKGAIFFLTESEESGGESVTQTTNLWMLKSFVNVSYTKCNCYT